MKKILPFTIILMKRIAIHGLSLRGGILVSLIFCSVINAQEPHTEHTLRLTSPENQQKATIEEMRWFAGYWSGEGLGGSNEEIWSPPVDGAMMGMYRMIKDGKVLFYEFCQIVEENESLNYKIKHFNPDFKGWEEKNDFTSFPLIKLKNQQAWFDGLTLKRDNDKLQIWVSINQKDGSVQEAEFNLRLVNKFED